MGGRIGVRHDTLGKTPLGEDPAKTSFGRPYNMYRNFPSRTEYADDNVRAELLLPAEHPDSHHHRFDLSDNINSRIIAFAFALAAEIERNLISQRTKEALAARKESGVHLGRPSGCGAKVRKLCSRSSEIEQMLASGKSLTAVASEFKVHRNTLTRCRKCNYDIKMLSGNC